MATWQQRLFERTPREQYLGVLRRVRSAQGREGLASEGAVFALSTGRVGTQTVAALANLASSVSAHHEPQPKLYALGKLAYERADEADTAVFEEAFRAMRAQAFEQAALQGSLYVETSPQLTFLAPVIDRVVDDARFIHLVREPNVVVRSAMRREWYTGNRADSTRIVPLPGSEFAEPWRTWSPVQKNYWLWAETNRWLLDYTAGFGGDRFVRLSSRTLFAGDTSSLEQLYRMLGRDMPAASRIDRVLGKNLNAQTTGDFEAPGDLAAALGAGLLDFVRAVATGLGIDEGAWLGG